jgi:hypothetical protein
VDLSDLSVRVAATVTTNIDCGWVRGVQSTAKGGMTHHCCDLLHCLLGRLAFRGHREELSHVSDSRVLSYRVMFFARRLDWPWMLKAESKLDLGVRISYCTISINSSPMCDCDTPDEIFISSTWLAGCDNGEISSGETRL